MNHRISRRKLNRTSQHRALMFRNMANSLFEHEHIRTTLPKAKELRKVVEPLITRGKEDSVHNRRILFARLRDQAMVAKLCTDIGLRFASRPGGYTRILKCGFRVGDNAPMAIIQLVEADQKPAKPQAIKKKVAKAPEAKETKAPEVKETKAPEAKETKAPEVKKSEKKED